MLMEQWQHILSLLISSTAIPVPSRPLQRPIIKVISIKYIKINFGIIHWNHLYYWPLRSSWRHWDHNQCDNKNAIRDNKTALTLIEVIDDTLSVSPRDSSIYATRWHTIAVWRIRVRVRVKVRIRIRIRDSEVKVRGKQKVISRGKGKGKLVKIKLKVCTLLYCTVLYSTLLYPTLL